ncbi:MAG: DnaT-like ssDNA-binding domain-containing protein [Gammaproteobacteria bacterium]|nr:DnaT-like ssDNA-binding domain-containing protein [Gammaproteobacteria bacterium]
MSIKAVNWALNNVKCSPDYKVILLAMAERADDHGICFPSQADLQQKTCIPLRSLKRKMSALKDLNVFSVITKQVQTNLRRNSYRLRLEESFDLLEARTVVSENNGAKLAPSLDSPEAQDGATVAPLNSANLAPSSEQWCHSSGTHNGATQVAHEPPSNHQLKPISSNTYDADVFSSQVPNRAMVKMTKDWKPSEQVLELITNTRGVPRTFCEDAIPEFTLYHRGAVKSAGAHDAAFLRQCVKTWDLYKSSTPASRMPEGWEPDQETIQRLRVGGVAVDFIWDQATRFAMYWRERNEPRHAWNAMFFENTLRMWNQRPAEISTPNERGVAGALHRLTDRSWAEPATGTGG